MDDESVNRITVKFLSPNPMFEEWLTIWRDEAAGRDSKMQYCFNTALQSIKKYPLPLESGRDCKILKGFGDKLCQMLDDKLQNYNSQPMNNSNFGRRQFLNENCTQKNISEGKKLTPVTYIPQYKSGAYAILITLYQKSQENKYKGYLTKNEIIKHGKALCNTSFTKTQPGSFYTAWSSMQQLLAKELVYKHSNPAKFSLTNSGIALARVLYEKSSQQDHVQTKTKYAGIIDTFTESGNHASAVGNKCHSALNTEQSFASLSENLSQKRNIRHEANQKLAKFASENLNLVSKKSVMELKSSENSSPQTSSTSIFECFIMPPNSFDIILYVDNCETSSRNMEEIQFGLRSENIKFEVKDLKVGDYVWICRDRCADKELILPYIIERKRMDDLASSIKDGRYYEQKFRLKKSGIENLTYLIESYGKNCHLGLPLTSLYQAATNTALQDNFFVQFSDNIKDTTQYLANMSRFLIKLYKSKTLVSCLKQDLKPVDLNEDLTYLMEFKEFNKSSIKSKKLKVKDLFVKMLIQIKGLSVDRALAIVEMYPTVYTLHKAYQVTPENKREKLLCNIKYGKHGKTIGPVLSKIIYQFFNKQGY